MNKEKEKNEEEPEEEKVDPQQNEVKPSFRIDVTMSPINKSRPSFPLISKIKNYFSTKILESPDLTDMARVVGSNEIFVNCFTG
jgi:hypothetical protein